MHEGMQYDPIQGQGSRSRALEYRKFGNFRTLSPPPFIIVIIIIVIIIIVIIIIIYLLTCRIMQLQVKNINEQDNKAQNKLTLTVALDKQN